MRASFVLYIRLGEVIPSSLDVPFILYKMIKDTLEDAVQRCQYKTLCIRIWPITLSV